MKRNARFIRTAERQLSPDKEQVELAAVFGGAPGINAFEVGSPDGRGGYWVFVDLACDSIDAFCSHIVKLGWGIAI